MGERKSQTKSFILGAIIGGVIGSIVGILYAPERGEKNRGALKKKTDEIGKKMKEMYEEAQKTAQEISGEISQKVEEMEKGLTSGKVESVRKKDDSSPKLRKKPRFFKGVK